MPGIYAPGDLVSYAGKLDLMATGYAEAAIAVNQAAHYLDPTARWLLGIPPTSPSSRTDRVGPISLGADLTPPKIGNRHGLGRWRKLHHV